ncbi:MAG: UDP-N-acetylglucosamine 1-carboxyvinyltransferase [Candidatus Berkelbacteria bacterium Licking1014_2]|uniref:UDP-N-acetylglucosamine 1-carboxyvinyltransferase n=1 Tax=Candidatus Berkelbacteria bacterium Licking1014_2 TaxID=2017146 RepID=A0A554LXW4_9BACT|nr:MAG: UDP-N-acetylglucosamine 1-carboxyvinyltransferase [Candidatus Berkelbacteria bacterium Licking1014_2]
MSGRVAISGSKNAALPILAASLLTTGRCHLTNMPDIDDVNVMLKILADLGSQIKRPHRHEIIIATPKIRLSTPNPQLVQRLRASILLAGALIARTGQCRLFHPGGCVIGRRPIDTHLEAFRQLGVALRQEDNYYQLTTKQLRGRQIFLDEVSVTATENAVMAACLARGKTTITPAACEPHVVDLCLFLQKMGYQISGAGNHTIVITTNNKQLSTINIEHRLISDEVETGTLAAAALITKGKITLDNAPVDNLASIIHKLRQFGGRLSIKKPSLIVEYTEPLTAAGVQVDTWPRLPTDLQPVLTVLATQSRGTSLIHDWMYERRLGYIDELVKMGASITLCDPHRAIVAGPTKLSGGQIISPDIRAFLLFTLHYGQTYCH